jgi:hypothetical protein
MIDTFNYPILWINKEDESIGIFFSRKELTIIPLGSQAQFREMNLYSGSGQFYRIASIEASESTNLVQLLLNSLKLKQAVDIKISQVQEDTDPRILSDKIVNIFLNNEDLWDADGEMTRVIELLKQAVSVREIIQIVKRKLYPSMFEQE